MVRAQRPRGPDVDDEEPEESNHGHIVSVLGLFLCARLAWQEHDFFEPTGDSEKRLIWRGLTTCAGCLNDV